MTVTHSAMVFAPTGSRDMGAAIARNMGRALGARQARDVEDGAHTARPRESVWGRDVHVVQSRHADTEQTPNETLCRLLVFRGAARDAGARGVTAVCPYLCDARKDRETKDFDPVTTRYVAGMLEAVGVDAVVTPAVHNLAAFQNALRCRTLHPSAHDPRVDARLPHVGETPLTVLSPNAGGTKRAEAFRARLAERTGARRSGGARGRGAWTGDRARHQV